MPRIFVFLFFFFSFFRANSLPSYFMSKMGKNESSIIEKDMSRDSFFLGRIIPPISIGDDKIFTYPMIVEGPFSSSLPARTEILRVFNIDIFDAERNFRIDFYGITPLGSGGFIYRIMETLQERDDEELFHAIEAYYRGADRGTLSAHEHLYAMLENHFRRLSEEDMKKAEEIRATALHYQHALTAAHAMFLGMSLVMGSPRSPFPE